MSCTCIWCERFRANEAARKAKAKADMPIPADDGGPDMYDGVSVREARLERMDWEAERSQL